MSKLLPFELSGNKDSNNLIVFLHGWPDTTALWYPIINSLEKDAYILNVSYPNYSSQEINPKGIDMEEIAERLKITIDHVNNNKKRKGLVVGHDWGAIFGYYLDFMYPNYITEMISLDVGATYHHYHPFFMLYQFILIFAYLIGGIVGKIITRGFLMACPHKPEWIHKVDGSWNYPYYYQWKKIFKEYGCSKKATLPGYQPSCKVTFVYGTKKPFQAFDKQWLETLKKNPENEVISISAIHWFQTEQPEFLVDLIKRRITNLQRN